MKRSKTFQEILRNADKKLEEDLLQLELKEIPITAAEIQMRWFLAQEGDDDYEEVRQLHLKEFGTEER